MLFRSLAFIEFLRLIADGVIEPEEAVRAYHAVLQKLGTPPHRPLEQDLLLQTNVMSYGGSGVTISLPPAAKVEAATPAANEAKVESPRQTSGAKSDNPDFAKMSSEERLAYHRERLKKTFGN